MGIFTASRAALKGAALASVGVLAVIAAPAYADVTLTWAPQTTDTGSGGDFDNATQLFGAVQASSLTFNAMPAQYAGGGYFHNHGAGTGFTISAILNGTNTVIFSSGPLSGGDIGLNTFGTINFASSLVSGISLNSDQYIGNAFHNFYDQSFTLGASVGVVPEPSAWLVLILGFGAVGGAMRKSRQRAMAVSYS